MLTKKQHELICFIADRLADTGVSPSFEEMKDALDLKSKSGVHRLISALEERGFLRRLPNRARALEVVKMPERGDAKKPAAKSNVVAMPRPAPQPANDVVEIPLHGRIAHAACRSRRWRDRRCFPSPPRCSGRANIMHSKLPGIRWSRPESSTATMR